MGAGRGHWWEEPNLVPDARVRDCVRGIEAVTETAIQTRLQLDDQGRVWIEGANTRVIQIAIDKYAHGWSAEQIQEQHPHLSLAQVHAALSYYYDHQAEMDAEIERMMREDDALRAQAGTSRAVQRLRQRGILP
jgi:uncharacterized protein (DUF433 family)